MHNTVLLIRDYDQVDPRITRALDRGATVYNAPRLIACDPRGDGKYCSSWHWTGDFRHGVFYAAILPDQGDGFNDDQRRIRRECNRRLDAYTVAITDVNTVRDYACRMARTYDRTVKLDDYPLDDWVAMFVAAYRRGDLALDSEGRLL